MTKPLLAALALAAVSLAAPPASAAGSAFRGGCDYDLVAEPTGLVGQPRTFQGTVSTRTVLTSASPSADLVSATITCTAYVRQDVVGSATFSGTGVVMGSEEFTLPGDTDAYDFRWCVTVDFTSDDTPTSSLCNDHTAEGFPPQVVYDALDVALDQAPGSRGAVCTALRAAGPVGVFGTLSVNGDGDLFYSYHGVWTCTAPSAARA